MKIFSTFNSHFSTRKGFTLIELVISMGIFIILIGVITLNLNSVHHTATLSSTVDTLLSDLGQQQIKAMVGDTEGRGTIDTYGIHFGTTDYTLFHGAYSAIATSNFLINLSNGQEVSTTFPSSEVVFQKGSGEIDGFISTQSAITVQDTINGQQKTIQLNQYGVVTGVN